MKRTVWLACVLFAGAAYPALAADQANESQQFWLIGNCVLLVGGLAYLIAKHGGPFYRSRLLKIREDIVQGQEAQQAAEQKAAEVDRRLANLEGEIAALRSESQRELENERELMRHRTEAESARILANAQQEIAAAGKTARAELKRYSAELAIGLAERKIRTRINPEIQDELIGSFVEMLDTPGGASAPQA